MLKQIMVDTHTHTVLSGHAWSTLRENAAAAAKRGMAGLCLTEHGHAMPGTGPFFLTTAQKMLPPEVERMRIYYGVEANIMDLKGGLDIEDRMLFASEWNIASMHDICVLPGTPEENTAAFKGALAHPAVDMLGHIDDGKTPNVIEEVVREAGRLGKIIEINNNSLLVRRGSRERVEEIARLCKRHDVRVAVSSDAHFDTMIGAVEPALELMAREDFPDELVINRSREAFDAYQAERTRRLDSVRESFIGNKRSVRRMAQGGK
jgi:Histidinol phosphatase and related hydrolases of the PHP family